MKKAIFVALVCAFATPALADANGDAKAAAEAWQKAFNDGDPKALAELYADNAVMVGPMGGQELDGKKDIEASFAASIKGKKGDMKFSDLKAIAVGDGLTVFGHWAGSMPTPDGKKKEVRLRTTTVYVKQGGKLMIVMEHASVALPGKMETHAPKGK